MFANRLAEKLKLDTTGDWDYDPQSSKEVVDQLGKKMVQGDVGKRPPNEQNKGEMDPCQAYADKQVPSGHHYGKS